MPRRQLFELLDFASCPPFIRDGATDYLQFIIRTGNAYGPVVSPLARALRVHDTRHIIDLCSGGGGPWPMLRTQLVNAGLSPDITVRLTDRFPNVRALAMVHDVDPLVSGETSRVDADAVPDELEGFRTLFSSFHHFAPPDAVRILRDAVSRSEGIAIAEVTRRHWLALAVVLISPLFVWLATPRLRPFSLARLFWTYLVPVIPFVVCFDGIVSCLRTYSVRELRDLIASLGDTGFDWDVGEARGRGPMAVTYAIGTPRAARTASGPTVRDF